ncbi:MAG TPA: hypothetical protein VGS15_00665 [Candidatus Acidoferrales bacterium]|nr:hypothetical protein [Candidatus Acidoferrales bacterium]
MRNLLAYAGAALMTCAALMVLAFGGSKGAAGQSVVDTTITVGGSVTFSIDASKLALVPGCSKSAGCVSTIKLCNLTSTGAVNPASCVVLNGTASNGNTAIGYTIEQAIPANTTTGAAAQSNDYTVATLRISVPAAEAEVVP